MSLTVMVTGRRAGLWFAGAGAAETSAEMPESFMVDAVEAGIRGLAHSTGEPVVVVLTPLRRGIFFAIISRFSSR